MRQSPISTLFPYTTLFRSELRREPAALVGLGEDELRPLERAVVLGALLNGLDDDPLDLLGRRLVYDRKSTRLNSSHTNISYDGVCSTKDARGSSHSSPGSG